jgi:IclR family mhp operon transcriptional activator
MAVTASLEKGADIDGDAGDAGSRGNIRSISRALDVLRAINLHRSLNMMAISNICKIPYPTACRIVETLLAEDVIERETSRKRYRPTARVKTLSVGYQEVNELADTSRPHITKLTRDVRWPISVCSRVGMSMMICESTHSIAPFTLNMYHPGYTVPILGSSSGKVYLAFSSDEDRKSILGQLRDITPASANRIIDTLEAEIDTIRTRGFSTYDRMRHTANPGKTSAISLPVLAHGKVTGTVTLAFFCSTLTMAKAIDTFLPPLKQTVRAIENDLLARALPN